ncbi:MAG: hypothetical protein JRI25_19550 [Deltaproteobacteria bacterium]|nr:hypothetical protein [Deltaproteobacteria bacterium]MBW2256771.1 hypothetical protein [Deltaproteobacteria bacterium]
MRKTSLYYRTQGGAERCTRPCCRGRDDASLEAGDSLALDDVIRAHLVWVLDLTNGKISGPEGAAELLRVNASTLRSKLARLGVPYRRRPRATDPME